MILDDVAPLRTITNTVGFPAVGQNGVRLDKLANLLNNNGVAAHYRAKMTLAELAKATSKGNPAVVAVRANSGGHAVVVDGVTTRLGQPVVAIRNPWGKQYFQMASEFEKVWMRQGVVTQGVK